MFRDPSSIPDWFMSTKISPKKSSIHGVGVFAQEDISEGELIERCPVFFFSRQTLKVLHDAFDANHILGDYVFYWDSKSLAAVLGYGMVYNHSKDYNIDFRKVKSVPCVEFTANRDIKKGEELFSGYYHGPLAKDITFDDVGSHVSSGRVTTQWARTQWVKGDD